MNDVSIGEYGFAMLGGGCVLVGGEEGGCTRVAGGVGIPWSINDDVEDE